MQGGKIYGEGVKGITMDISCIHGDKHTLCKKIKKNKVSSINLISFHNKHKIKDIDAFVDYLSKLDDYVIKIFKSDKFSDIFNFFSITNSNFTNEMTGIKQIHRIYSKNLSKYTTIQKLNYHGFDFIGLELIFENDEVVHGTISRKCSYQVDKYKFKNEIEFKIFISQTIESLSIMQSHNYAHIDLKPDNIIYCDSNKSFKIIDWELLRPLSWRKSKQYFANPTHSAPLAMFIYGNKPYDKIYNSNKSKNPTWHKSTEFNQILDTYKEQLEIIKKNKTSRQLFHHYKYHFDMFALAMSFGHLLHKNQLNFKEFMPFILKMTSLIDSERFINASEALTWFKKTS